MTPSLQFLCKEQRQLKCVETKCSVRKYFWKARENDDRLCGLVVRVLGYTTEMYCVSCEVRTEFIYVM
jgi:hypothetical protein